VAVTASTSSAPGQFRYSVGGRFAQPDAQGSFDSSPYLYNVRGDVDVRGRWARAVTGDQARTLPLMAYTYVV
jgi:hypothetical protein